MMLEEFNRKAVAKGYKPVDAPQYDEIEAVYMAVDELDKDEMVQLYYKHAAHFRALAKLTAKLEEEKRRTQDLTTALENTRAKVRKAFASESALDRAAVMLAHARRDLMEIQ